MRKAFFDHVPKTGGTAVTHAILGAMGMAPDEVPDMRLLGTLRYADLIEDYAALPWIGAHTEFNHGDRLDARRVHCVLLRDPIERLLSTFAFNRSDVPLGANRDEAVRDAKVMDLEHYLLGDGRFRGYAVNWYVAHFMPLAWDGGAAPGEKESFELAARALELFDVVGFQDDVEEFCDAVCAAMGIDAEPHVRIVNATASPLAATGISAELQARLRERLAWDYALYDHARGLRRRQRRRRVSVATDAAGVRDGAPPRQRKAEAGDAPARVTAVEIGGDLSGPGTCMTDEPVNIVVRIQARHPVAEAGVGVALNTMSGRLVYGTSTAMQGRVLSLAAGEGAVVLRMHNRLAPGDYRIDASLHGATTLPADLFDVRRDVARLRVQGGLGRPFAGLADLQAEFGVSGSANLDLSAAARESRVVREGGLALTTFESRLELQGELPPMRAGDAVRLVLQVTNPSPQRWRASGDMPVRLAYQWLDDADGTFIERDGVRTPLPADMPAGDSRPIPVTVIVPRQRGRMRLRVSVLQEDVAWFYEQGAAPLEVVVDVSD